MNYSNIYHNNDTHRKDCFAQFSKRIYWNISLTASDLFPMFTQSVYFYTFYFHRLEKSDSSSRQKWMVASFGMWQSLEVLNFFNTLTLNQIFWKTKTFYKKLEHCFLAESTKNDNITFPYKTSGVTGSKPGQVRLKDFWVHKLAWIEKKSV